MQSILSKPADKITVDIVDAAIAAGNFSTLVNAIKAADLVAVLKGTGPFTVFAPTDEAFKKLAAGELDGLLKDKVKLAGILNHHVISGKTMAADAQTSEPKTAAGNTIKIVRTGDALSYGGAVVTKADIETSNGVIHAIDTVVMPS
jgi:uncharacterized surface protein with fasciclin (FAS1) repeats